MTQTLKTFLIATLLSVGLPALAQEATDGTTAEEPTQEGQTDGEASVPAVPGELSMGEEVLQIGQPYLAQEFGDWQLRCLTTPEDQVDPCQLYQLLQDANGNNVAEISMFPLPNGGRAAAGATIVVPLETLLTEQLTLSVDGSSVRRYPFTFCNSAGCVSRVGFTADEVAQFKRGNAARIRLVPAGAPEEEVILDVSLTGFTAGYDSIGEGQ